MAETEGKRTNVNTKQSAINEMKVLSPYISIITLNVNRLNLANKQTKDTEQLDSLKQNRTKIYVLLTRESFKL